MTRCTRCMNFIHMLCPGNKEEKCFKYNEEKITMNKKEENLKACDDTVDIDCISKSRLVRQLCNIDDIEISPKAFNRIVKLVADQVPYNEVDYRNKEDKYMPVLDFNNECVFRYDKNDVNTLAEESNTKLHDILEEKGYCTVRDLFGFGSPNVGWVKEDE